MKAVPFEFNGETYSLLYNGAAMFEIDKIRGGRTMFEAISEDFDSLCGMLAVMAHQGELVRRYEGNDHGPMLDSEALRLLASPVDIISARALAMNAVLAGMGREIEEEGDIDVGLQEIQKKTVKASKKRTT